MSNTYKITIEYFGPAFIGWQKQNSGISVQEIIETALQKITNHPTPVFCAGRTDSGVHALAQVASFSTNKEISEHNMMYAINYHMQSNYISIIDCKNLGNNSDFHARFSAKSREYIYKIFNREINSPLHYNYFWWVSKKLDYIAMNKASQVLIGKHDFSTFRAKGCQANSPIKTISDISVTKEDDFIINTYIKAPSFLYHQVRNIVGSLYLVGTKKWNQEDFINAFNTKDRSKGGATAPAHGLYFLKANY